MSKCQGCERALRDGYLCRTCVGRVDQTLAELPELIIELMTTAYRQDRIAFATGRGTGERPLPYRAKATQLLADVRRHLLGCTGPTPLTDAMLCKLIRTGLPYVALTDPDIGRVMVLVEDEAAIREMIDLPKSYRYLGRCDHCGAELYADRTADVWVCQAPSCEASYDVRARMAELVERARDVVATVPTIATALTSLDMPVTEELIRKWRERGMLTPRSMVGRSARFRVGDVIDLVMRQRLRAASRSQIS